MIRDILRGGYRAVQPLLFSRSKFKLFLKTSLEDVDARLRHLAWSSDFFSGVVRPIPIRAPFGESMLVVAPHQDDEIIGCGGALALQVQAGRGAFVVLLQDGGGEHEAAGMTRQELVELRNEESRRSAAALGIDPPRFLGHQDLASDERAAADELRSIILERKADAIFIPFVLDAHPDHRTANHILSGALKGVPWNVRVFGYEVWGLAIPNVIVAIDDVIEQKTKLLSCFTYANQAVDYVNSTKGLNMYHSRLLGAGMCKYAECYFEVPKDEYSALVDRLRTGDPADRRAV